MIIETHNKLKEPSRAVATRLVVYDDNNNPVVVVMAVGPSQLVISTVSDPDFNKVLRNFGINKTVVVNELQQAPISQLLIK